MTALYFNIMQSFHKILTADEQHMHYSTQFVDQVIINMYEGFSAQDSAALPRMGGEVEVMYSDGQSKKYTLQLA